jgi:hypothetical protein
MLSSILLYIGSGIIFIWGVAHIIPTMSIVKGFGELTDDNRRIIIMEWIAEGLTLCFIGVLVFLITFLVGPQDLAAGIVYRVSYIMLALMAALSANTGARTSIVPMKICPWIKMTVAVLFLLGTIV